MGRTPQKPNLKAVRNGLFRKTIDLPLESAKIIIALAKKDNRDLKNWIETTLINIAKEAKIGEGFVKV